MAHEHAQLIQHQISVRGLYRQHCIAILHGYAHLSIHHIASRIHHLSIHPSIHPSIIYLTYHPSCNHRMRMSFRTDLRAYFEDIVARERGQKIFRLDLAQSCSPTLKATEAGPKKLLNYHV